MDIVLAKTSFPARQTVTTTIHSSRSIRESQTAVGAVAGTSITVPRRATILLNAAFLVICRASHQGASRTTLVVALAGVAAVVVQTALVSVKDGDALFLCVLAANIARQGDDLAVGHDALVAVADGLGAGHGLAALRGGERGDGEEGGKGLHDWWVKTSVCS